jgi:hypothetical protein
MLDSSSSPLNNSSGLNFQDWMKANPDFVKDKMYIESKRWGRVICEWDEKIEKDGKTETFHHVYLATVDLRTGDLYMDCRKRKLVAKHITQALIRPLEAAVMTAYHASGLGVAVSFGVGIKKICEREYDENGEDTKGNTKEEYIKKRAVKFFEDAVKSGCLVVLSPTCGIGLTVTSLATLMIAPFSPTALYEGRKIAGKIEQIRNCGTRLRSNHLYRTIAFCFQSNCNMIAKDPFGIRAWNDTNKGGYLNPKEIQKVEHVEEKLKKYGDQQLFYRRDRWEPFNKGRYPKGRDYRSAAQKSFRPKPLFPKH